MKITISQLPHATFINRQHHGLHIPSFLVNQLKSRTRKLYVRLNSADATKHSHLGIYIVALKHNHTRTPNLINDAILSLSRYWFHLQDADQPLITLILKNFLQTQPFTQLLGLPLISSTPQHEFPFTLLGHSHFHTQYKSYTTSLPSS